jgi:formamidopyrimidine-DNA glycosylase
MPELPEVEITRRGISPDLVGKKLTGVIARTRALRYPLPAGFDRLLTGELLRDIQRRGKYLLLDFGKGLRAGTPRDVRQPCASWRRQLPARTQA